jgi:hypothetical protein
MPTDGVVVGGRASQGLGLLSEADQPDPEVWRRLVEEGIRGLLDGLEPGRGEVVGHGAAGGVDDEREDARPPARVELDGRSRGGEHDHDDGQPENQTNRTSTAIGARYHAQAPPVSGSSSPQLAHGAHRGRGAGLERL